MTTTRKHIPEKCKPQNRSTSLLLNQKKKNFTAACVDMFEFLLVTLIFNFVHKATPNESFVDVSCALISMPCRII